MTMKPLVPYVIINHWLLCDINKNILIMIWNPVDFPSDEIFRWHPPDMKKPQNELDWFQLQKKKKGIFSQSFLIWCILVISSFTVVWVFQELTIMEQQKDVN